MIPAERNFYFPNIVLLAQTKWKHHPKIFCTCREVQWFNNVSLLFISVSVRENVMWARTSLWKEGCWQIAVFFSFSTALAEKLSLCWLCWVGTAVRVVITIDGQQIFSQADTPSAHKWSVWDWSVSVFRIVRILLFSLESTFTDSRWKSTTDVFSDV